MKNKILAIMLATVIVVGTSIPAFATPDNQQLSDSRQKYAEIENKIATIQSKIYDLDIQIEPLQLTVDKNKKEITNVNKVIDNTTKDIEQCKKEIDTLDLALGQRVKAMYMSGDLEFNYLSFILESESTSDFFSRAEKVSQIVGKDKSAIDGITNKKEELNTKMKSLEDKKTEIDKLNKEVQVTLSELDVKKKDQEVLVSQAKDERSKFDSQYLSQLERDLVKPQMDALSNSNSSASDLQAAIDQLRKIRDNQIKSVIVTAEINDKIEKAKVIVDSKKAAEVKVTTASRGRTRSSVAVPSAGNAQAILNEAYAQLGKPYVYGATGSANFDCSGFTQYVYENAAGIDISRTTYSQINEGQAVSEDQLQPGDLVFPHTGHVGIYVGNGQMIHAPQTGDVVKVSPVPNVYAARRILN
ncbi:hypothetical protein psyc5s11_52290 [Clostridium gelidum]|uniref:NlpC/P60 domain-containing protein n=1 Tax=Clostridium gelidum TaxID=704125 RepID=A0ABM7TB41_9CLOT|nr:C40 family peptidase [Clostridium gelidum]BCZ49162.1 hypothetical protein psyc5s11_52290 [Clostridium gelidum]